MIAASLDTRDLLARLDRMPAQLRTALADALDRALRPRIVPPLSLSIDATSDMITATIRTAGVPPALPRSRAPARNRIIYHEGHEGHAKGTKASQPLNRLRVLRGPFVPFVVSGSLFPPPSEIRAALEAAAREAFNE